MDDDDELRRQGGAQARQIGRIALQAGQRGVGIGLAEERDTTGEALVEHQAEGIEISAPVELLAADLFGRQVLRRSHHDVVAGEIVAAVTVQPLGDPEVGEEDPPLGRVVGIG